MDNYIYSLFLIILINCSRVFCSSIICESGYCGSSSSGCTYNTTNCEINNGIWLLSPTTCNCCDYCLGFLSEGSVCTTGGAGDGVTTPRCGDGLTCLQNTCVRMDTECHRLQDEYDERYISGTLGFLEERPRCDAEGNYAPAKCLTTQTCYCQSEDGRRLFGEALYTNPNILSTMLCGCSRRHDQISKNLGRFVDYPVLAPRCTPDGGYNPIQCISNICYCVDILTGDIEQSEFINLNTNPVSKLTCYDETLDIAPELTSGSEAPYNYTTYCLRIRDRQIELIQDSLADGYIVDYYTNIVNCSPGGSYGKISLNNNGSKICINEYGYQIENYSAARGTTQYDEMNCNCAYTALLMKDSIERPICCNNGNFRPIQCRRGKCYCVDQNGHQIEQEKSDITLLTCYTEHWRDC